jgi:hypothetical protein
MRSCAFEHRLGKKLERGSKKSLANFFEIAIFLV